MVLRVISLLRPWLRLGDSEQIFSSSL